MSNEVVSCTAVNDGRYLIAVTKDGKVFYGWASGKGFHPGWDKITWTRTTDIPLEAPKV
tara:strand:- start:198 stop:374 length:177 start_codon:yes stop_codon:yes gene_type:complete